MATKQAVCEQVSRPHHSLSRPPLPCITSPITVYHIPSSCFTSLITIYHVPFSGHCFSATPEGRYHIRYNYHVPYDYHVPYNYHIPYIYHVPLQLDILRMTRMQRG